MCSRNIATCEGSISTNGTIQGSVGGGRPVSNLTNKGVPEGYSGSGNHLTWAVIYIATD